MHWFVSGDRKKDSQERAHNGFLTSESRLFSIFANWRIDKIVFTMENNDTATVVIPTTVSVEMGNDTSDLDVHPFAGILGVSRKITREYRPPVL